MSLFSKAAVKMREKKKKDVERIQLWYSFLAQSK